MYIKVAVFSTTEYLSRKVEKLKKVKETEIRDLEKVVLGIL
jgi:predicted nuclease of restriction endonuclease-like RecB superfamily